MAGQTPVLGMGVVGWLLTSFGVAIGSAVLPLSSVELSCLRW